jgi:hypothetical protein
MPLPNAKRIKKKGGGGGISCSVLNTQCDCQMYVTVANGSAGLDVASRRVRSVVFKVETSPLGSAKYEFTILQGSFSRKVLFFRRGK